MCCCRSGVEGRCSEDKATQQATSLGKSVKCESLAFLSPLILFVNSCFPSPGQDSFLYTVRKSLTYVGKELKWKSHSKPQGSGMARLQEPGTGNADTAPESAGTQRGVPVPWSCFGPSCTGIQCLRLLWNF